jgi:ferredoxin-NADP reductase
MYKARLERKICLSESAQCFHLEFVVDELENFRYAPGQFISAVAMDSRGKLQTRGYSIASASRGNRFALLVNRVEGGFFSNYLADLTDLDPGDVVEFNGPHGYFVLREPITDSILISTGTGIAPIRAHLQWLFPEDGADLSAGKEIWCVFGTRYESELYYRDELEALAAQHPNFHYLASLSRADASWTGLRGYVQEHVAHIIEERAARLNQPLPLPPVDPAIPANDLRFDIYAYVCGLNNMISSVRERLKEYGWHRKQMVCERYD